MSKNDLPYRKKVSLQLLSLAFLFSAIFSLTITALELFVEYRGQVDSIEKQFESIEKNYSSSLAHSVWYVIDDLINNHLSIITELPGISYAAIITPDGYPNYYAGHKLADNYREFSHILSYRYKPSDSSFMIGKLMVEFDLNYIYSNVARSAANKLIYQIPKNIILVLFFLYFFNRVVTRHIYKIVDHLSSIRFGEDNRSNSALTLAKGLHTMNRLTLDRDYNEDELQFLVTSINETQDRTQQYLEQLKEQESTHYTQLQILTQVLDSTKQYFINYNEDGQVTYSNTRQLESDVVRMAMEKPLRTLKDLKKHFLAFNFNISLSPYREKHDLVAEYLYSIEVEDPLHSVWLLCAFEFADGGTNILCTEMSEIRKLERSQRQSEKMKLVGSIASGIAHDLNNFLFIIKVSLEILRMKGSELTEHENKKIKIALHAVKHSSNIVQSLLTFSHQDNTALDVVNLETTLDNLLPMLDGILPDDIQFDYDCQTCASVYLAEGMLETAIINLVVNARDAIDTQGNISLITRYASPVELEEAELRHLKNAVVIEIIDSGKGIPEGVRSKIFEPFFTTKEKGVGTGLGLAQVHSFAESSGGRLQYKNGKESGSVFQIILPVYQPGTESKTIRQAVFASDERENTVLLVEDELDLLELMTEYLQNNNITVQAAGSLDEAIAILKGPDVKHISLIITDLNLKDGTGDQLTEALAKLEYRIPIILMSGGDQLSSMGNGKLDMFDRVIKKPFNLGSLVDTISPLLDNKAP